MPGLLLCFVMRYDAYKKSQLLHFGETGVPPPRHLSRIRQETNYTIKPKYLYLGDVMAKPGYYDGCA